MGIVFDGRFLLGVVVGLVALKMFHYYKARQ